MLYSRTVAEMSERIVCFSCVGSLHGATVPIKSIQTFDDLYFYCCVPRKWFVYLCLCVLLDLWGFYQILILSIKTAVLINLRSFINL